MHQLLKSSNTTDIVTELIEERVVSALLILLSNTNQSITNITSQILFNLLNNISNLSNFQSMKLTEELLEVICCGKYEKLENIDLKFMVNISFFPPNLFSSIDRNTIDKLESLLQHNNIEVSNYVNETLKNISLSSSNKNYYICNNPDTSNENIYLKSLFSTIFLILMFFVGIMRWKMKKLSKRVSNIVFKFLLTLLFHILVSRIYGYEINENIMVINNSNFVFDLNL